MPVTVYSAPNNPCHSSPASRGFFTHSIMSEFQFSPSDSKFPGEVTTIFSVMSKLAQQHQAINLGQGFPDFDCDPTLIERVTAAMQAGINQYPPMPGLPTLRNAIADKIRIASDSVYDAESEITVTAGATQALLTTILTFVHAGDEVIIIEPAYDSYLPSIHLAGGIAKPVQMELDGNRYFIPWDKVKQSITPRTRMLILNSPHNPTGTVLTQDDIEALKDCVRDSGILILSDEVYEHIIFDGQIHASMASDPELKARSLIVSSFGKTFHVTGWKVGYIAAPKMLSTEFRKVHQYNVFTVNSPMQAALAEHLSHSSQHWELPAFYQEKRDYFRHGLQQTRFELLPCYGTYFQSVRYRDISDLPEREFAEWITREAGVACIPMSAFYQKPTDSGVVRFCFAKRQSTLDQALQRLQAL